jgi:cellulose synthase/poly-beta-1,6-N-acetylglucosamine synthase-like glycosyltransferase
MTLWEFAVLLFQFFILSYMGFVNFTYTLLGYFGIEATLHMNRVLSRRTLKNLLETNYTIPVSILVPAYNEELSIVASVRSFLDLQHTQFEVIVVSDGSKDATVQQLIEAYDLIALPVEFYQVSIPTQAVKRFFRSKMYPNLTVIEKENGGKADALNAALNQSRYPLVCAVDADSILDGEALLRTILFFIEDETVVAVGGTIRPLNGTEVKQGQVRNLYMPSGWIERFQILEYGRAFYSGRMGWLGLDTLLIISGAFGVFKRDALLAIHGYATDTITEDMELVLRLHRHYLEAGTPYRIRFTPDPLCWTEVPSSMQVLRRQRNRWHRGLIETLWKHRRMTLNPRYGRLGMIVIPYFWLVEAFSPIIEVLGYAFLPISYLLGWLWPEFALWFLLFSVLYGVFLSAMTVGLELLLIRRYTRMRDRLLLLSCCLLEFFGYRQIVSVERFMATFQIAKKRGQWGVMQRKGIS